jgi:hypothetical protein
VSNSRAFTTCIWKNNINVLKDIYLFVIIGTTVYVAVNVLTIHIHTEPVTLRHTQRRHHYKCKQILVLLVNDGGACGHTPWKTF